VPAGLHPVAAGLEAVQPYGLVRYERVEDADGVRAAADTRGHRVRQPPDSLETLCPRLDADAGDEVADDLRERVRPRGRAQQVVRGVHGRHPVAQRLVERVLECARAGGHRDHGRAEHLHPRHVQRLPPGVDLPHVDHALKVEQRGRGGAGDAVLASAGLRDDPRLAHPLGQQRLAEHVAHLVCAGVVQVLALEQDLRAELGGEPIRGVEQRRNSRVVPQQAGEALLELRVGLRDPVRGVQLVERLDQRLGDEATAVPAEMTGEVRHHRTGRGVAGWLPALTSSATASRGLF
jgi:hypothetical protein